MTSTETHFTWERGELEVTPADSEYATLPIDEAFDWESILAEAKTKRSLGTSALYLVAFRSTLKEGVDTSLLLEHDRRAHDAALESPALIHYFGGTPNELRQSLSFCLWTNAEDARSIARDQRHADAARMVSLYTHYSIEKYDVVHTDNAIQFVPHGAPIERTAV